MHGQGSNPESFKLRLNWRAVYEIVEKFYFGSSHLKEILYSKNKINVVKQYLKFIKFCNIVKAYYPEEDMDDILFEFRKGVSTYLKD